MTHNPETPAEAPVSLVEPSDPSRATLVAYEAYKSAYDTLRAAEAAYDEAYGAYVYATYADYDAAERTATTKKTGQTT